VRSLLFRSVEATARESVPPSSRINWIQRGFGEGG
jgi:hypothetical protein